jgi:hypothetical protein
MPRLQREDIRMHYCFARFQGAIVNCCGQVIELGGGLVESEAVLEDDSLDDIRQQFVAV